MLSSIDLPTTCLLMFFAALILYVVHLMLTDGRPISRHIASLIWEAITGASRHQRMIAAALERYDAEQRAEEARIQAIQQEPVPVIALRQTGKSSFGIGADGELIELEPNEASDEQSNRHGHPPI